MIVSVSQCVSRNQRRQECERSGSGEGKLSGVTRRIRPGPNRQDGPIDCFCSFNLSSTDTIFFGNWDAVSAGNIDSPHARRVRTISSERVLNYVWLLVV